MVLGSFDLLVELGHGAADEGTLPFRKKSGGEHTALFRERVAVRQMEPLRDAVARWAEKAAIPLEYASPQVPRELVNRTAELCTPLLAIADLLGSPWPEDARQWATDLERARPTAADENVQLLADCRKVLETYDGTASPPVNWPACCQPCPTVPSTAALTPTRWACAWRTSASVPGRSGLAASIRRPPRPS